MVRADILGALKSAMSRGQSLQQAIQTLVNSGYLVQEINEAASYLQTEPQIQQSTIQTGSVQKVSSYEQPQKKQPVKNKIFLIILIITLIFLFGFLISTIIFREKLAEIIFGMFG